MPKPTIDITKLKGEALFKTLFSASKGRSTIVANKPKTEAKLTLEQSIMELERASKLVKSTEWQPKALCHIQQIIHCSCGTSHASFIPGYFIRLESKLSSGVQFKSATADAAASSLPREIHRIEATTTTCPACFNRPRIRPSFQLELSF